MEIFANQAKKILTIELQDVLQQHVWKEEEDELQLSLDHRKPDLLQVKEEGLSPSKDGQLLKLKQETDVTIQVKTKDEEMTKDVSQYQICQQQLCKQERGSSLDLEEKQPRSIKEEKAELLSRHEGQRPVVKQEMDTLTMTPYNGEDANIETEPRSITFAGESQVLDGKVWDFSSSAENTEMDLDERFDRKKEPVSSPGNSALSDKGKELCFCQTCGKGFKNSSSLKVHMRIHTGERPYTCETCGKSFTQNSTLAYHTRVHTDERPFSCSKCGKSFSQRGTLNVHMRTHTEARSFPCDVCGKTYTRFGSLTVHMRSHTGERPFLCERCDQSFFCRSTLNSHMRTHTGERPFFCQVCEKAFSQNSTLVAHVRTHSGERPFSCETCGKSYTKLKYLTRHMKNHK